VVKQLIEDNALQRHDHEILKIFSISLRFALAFSRKSLRFITFRIRLWLYLTEVLPSQGGATTQRLIIGETELSHEINI